MNNDEQWIEAYQAADRLNRTERQVYRYGATGQVRTRKLGRRTQYHKADIEQLAEKLGIADEPRPPREPRHEIMPASAILDYLRERDRQLEQAQREIQRLMYELGMRDTELQRQLEAVTCGRDELKEQQKQIKKPWWKFWSR